MSEYLRIQLIQEQQRRCDATAALQRARSLYGTQSCASCPSAPTTNKQVQLESQRVQTLMSTCTTIVRAPPVPESTRIATLIQNVVYESTNPLNPNTRFSEYARFFPAPCPPPDTQLINASQPKPSTRCQLDNKPVNPILPA